FSRDWSSDVCSSDLKNPLLADPVRRKSRVKSRQNLDKTLREFVLAKLEIFVVGGNIIATVNKVVAAVMGAIHIVRVLYQRQERELRAGFVRLIGWQAQPIRAVGQKLPVQRQNNHHGAHILQRVKLSGVALR